MNILEQYIEQLATKHRDIRHSKAEVHFLDATRKKTTALDSVLVQPSVIIDRGGGFKYNGLPGALFKNRDYRLFIVDHVSDTGDYDQIQDAFDFCERILDEFLNQMGADKLKPEYRFLRSFSMENVDVVYIENNDNALYGVMAMLDLNVPYCAKNNTNPFA